MIGTRPAGNGVSTGELQSRCAAMKLGAAGPLYRGSELETHAGDTMHAGISTKPNSKKEIGK